MFGAETVEGGLLFCLHTRELCKLVIALPLQGQDIVVEGSDFHLNTTLLVAKAYQLYPESCVVRHGFRRSGRGKVLRQLVRTSKRQAKPAVPTSTSDYLQARS